MSRFREILKLWSLDIVPYTIGVGGWSQPPGGLNRKSDLPLFILEKVPSAHYTPDDPLNGDEFIKCVSETYQGLNKEERKMVEVRARKFLAKRITTPSYYEYGYETT